MTQQELTILNLGQSLDDIANIDPRGYGVCKTLYKASREYIGEPLCMNAAKKLVETLSEGDIVYIMTGFVLHPYKCAETDGIISAMLLCRSLVLAFGAKPVIICPSENLKSVENLASCIGLHLFYDLEQLKKMPVSMGVVEFTKDASKADAQAKSLYEAAMPKAVISIECPGANEKGVYHNATGIDVTALEAKEDVIFDIAVEKGILNIAIGDLGNEIGMGTIGHQLEKYIPYAAKGRCRCGCDGGIAVRTKTDNIITATVSDWGCYAMIASLSYLTENINVMHTSELEKEVLLMAGKSGLIDMYGWLIPAIDGFGLEMNLPIVSLMREMVVQALSLKDKCKTWFEKVSQLHFFEQ